MNPKFAKMLSEGSSLKKGDRVTDDNFRELKAGDVVKFHNGTEYVIIHYAQTIGTFHYVPKKKFSGNLGDYDKSKGGKKKVDFIKNYDLVDNEPVFVGSV